MVRPSTRVAHLGTTIFAEMSALAARTGAVNLGQGFPDTSGPPELLDRARAAIAAGENQYAPGLGTPELRAAIARHQARHHGIELDPDREVVVTTGATEAIAAAVLGLVDPGDEVVVLEPFYDSYVAMAQMAGAVPVPVTLRAPEFRLPVDELRAAVGPRTRAIMVNTPHNPTGVVLGDDELVALAEIAEEHDLVVISDEVYEHLTFDGVRHRPLATVPGLTDRTVTISSAGKSFSVTGWKVGWATGPAELVGAVMAAKQWLSYTSGTPFQGAVAWALDHADGFVDQLGRDLQAQRNLLCDGLEAVGFDVIRPAATYFATTDIRPLGFDDGLDFCRRLPELAGVVAVPHQVLHLDPEPGRPYVRWAFCKRPEVIAEALVRLQRLSSR
ncbi:MAG: pyridoxal phosphate-dependent aminotransferase [Aeromicrobium sp.]|uniref:pyridoxal phosphate-dependent aminotransferase n=1 Tax=Aeromicrobium sp. TaxID=1871063 RepID=UPI002615BC65|nr:pyridoxal phosphate-dependent aminotransferase [Aeromicrobium sp.]MDF1704765.1 pyridoxal phosphate-dependent aminotransferase [Aeromicrobium sp.]